MITDKLEKIKRIGTKRGLEYWFARELQGVLEYTEWRNFVAVIEKAKEACKGSGINVDDEFVDFNKIVEAGATKKPVHDIAMSRYACYLVVQNGDPSKEVIAKAQTYFAVQTRRQELADNFPELPENEKRLALRVELSRHNTQLASAAKAAGVEEPVEYAIFQNEGYKGLYGGLTQEDIHTRKKLKKSQKILDYMGSTELAANLFRATQTEEKLRRDNITGKENANRTHYNVGAKVRKTIKELGGTMPEKLPTPGKSIQRLEKEQRKKLND
jgi:DNA-damage-inducible protein D